MRTLLSHWKFHKAGQGCFYSGLISAHGRQQFSFVFDCGSTKGAGILREEIDAYKAALKNAGKNNIDLLVLSHYDADHVNQLPALLKDLRCEVAVLPYLSNWQRLFVYASQVTNDSTDNADYQRFLTDPARYLSELNIKRIIFIDGNDKNNDGLSDLSKTPDGPRRFSFSRETADAPGSNIAFPDLKGEVQLTPLNNSNIDDPEIKRMLNYHTNVEFALANGSITAGAHWEFSSTKKNNRPCSSMHSGKHWKKTIISSPIPNFSGMKT